MYVRDQLVRDLHGAMGQVAVQGRWVALYLNGVYWGLYDLTERIDDTFLATHFGASEWYVSSADVLHRWNRFVGWLNGTDLRAMARYEQAAQQLDIENFTSYFLLNIWAQNVDWPHNNRIVARPREGVDGRWRFIVWDAETAFMNTENTFEARGGRWHPARAGARQLAAKRAVSRLLHRTDRAPSGRCAGHRLRARTPGRAGCRTASGNGGGSRPMAAWSGAGSGGGTVGSGAATGRGLAGCQ